MGPLHYSKNPSMTTTTHIIAIIHLIDRAHSAFKYTSRIPYRLPVAKVLNTSRWVYCFTSHQLAYHWRTEWSTHHWNGNLITWWRHQMETFSALLALCAGNSPVTGEFPSHRPVTRSFDVFFDLHQNKRLSIQSRRRWFETPSSSLWRHCNDFDECFISGCTETFGAATYEKFIKRQLRSVEYIDRVCTRFCRGYTLSVYY